MTYLKAGPGQTDGPPAWYRLIRAARSLGQHPADVAGIPESRFCATWAHWGLMAENAEAEYAEWKATRKN